MPRIASIGRVEWLRGAIFSLREYQEFLDRMIEEIPRVNPDYLYCQPEAASNLHRRTELRAGRDTGLLKLSVALTLNERLEVDRLPACFIASNHYQWVVTPDCDVSPDEPLVQRLILGLARYTGQKVQVRLDRDNYARLELDFLVQEYAIYSPPVYLNQLAKKMAKWAKEDNPVLLDKSTSQNLRWTIGVLKTTASKIDGFLAMIDYCETRGVKPSAELKRAVRELKGLLRKDGLPENMPWFETTLTWAATNLRRLLSLEQEEAMDSWLRRRKSL